MGRKRKYTFKDRAEAEAAWRKEKDRVEMTLHALRDELLGLVTWERKDVPGEDSYSISLGVTRLDGPLGGIAILREETGSNTLVSVDLFEDLARRARELATHGDEWGSVVHSLCCRFRCLRGA